MIYDLSKQIFWNELIFKFWNLKCLINIKLFSVDKPKIQKKLILLLNKNHKPNIIKMKTKIKCDIKEITYERSCSCVSLTLLKT